MMKKLFLLIALLAFAGSANAATAIWNGPVGSAGDWATSTNWSGSGLPASSNDTYLFRASGTDQSIVTVSTTTAGALRFFLGQTSAGLGLSTSTQSNVLLTINSGAAIQVRRDTMAWSPQTGSQSVIDIYGTYNACMAPSAGLGFNVASGTTAVSTDVTHVRDGGILNIGIGSTSGNLNIASQGSGAGTVNVYSGGAVNVKTGYAIGTNGKLYVENTGIIWIAGDKTALVSADILAGKIAGLAVAGTSGVTYGYDASHVIGADTGATWIMGVPEPATVALLGLGSLMFFRKKR